MSKKFLPIMFVLMGAGLFVGLKSMGKSENNDENPKLRYAKILRNVGILLEEGHYSPRKIDDAFSKTVLKRFIEDLDGEKNIFLQSDIDAFKKYETKIDDEIHGAEIESFFDINNVYLKRQAEVATLYTTILAKPFDFTINETIESKPEKMNFPTTEAERTDMWRKRFKYLALVKYTDLLDERTKNKDKKDFKVKADSTLERESRDFVRKQMERYFTTKKTRETVDQNFSDFVNAIVGTMDPHTDYFAPVDLRSFNESMKGSFYGIGAQLKEEDGKIKITSLVSGMPAWRSGELKENDEIIKIAQGANPPVDVTGYSVEDAVKLIRGEQKGSEVRLTVKKIDGSIKVVSLLRDVINLDETFAKSAIVNGAHKIGYIYLPEFYADFSDPKGRRCAADVAKEIAKLKAENVEGIVLDLRGNGGGSLYDVVQMAGLFIEDGPIVQVKSRDEKPSILRDRDKSVLWDGPLAVMIDEGSASASEIFAAAIQDYKRGIIIGSTSSYGKGTVQRTIPLNPESENTLLSNNKAEDLGSLKLTLQKFYRINGGATQLKGVTPDVVLPDRFDYLKIREKDNPYALQWDEIAKADFTPWMSTSNISSVVSSANAETASSNNFNKIKANVAVLAANADKPYSLNIKQYEADQQKLKAIYKNLEEAYKLAKPNDVLNLSADSVEINASKQKVDRNKQFIKRIGEDIYIDETVKIINKMIVNDKVAKQQ
ncbi:carboxy terminal-processing peptidase [Ferruginibacter yonginensis]|uniref:Carboxy terminal-processing peptidase n=1 Tax=Ferruginibacter yonginensis TaxID=1310416 RepID=A0ABV8QNL9_9BACT